MELDRDWQQGVPLLGGGHLLAGSLPALPDLSGLDLTDEEIQSGARDTLMVCAECGTVEHASGEPQYNEELEALGRRHEVYVAGNLYRHPLALTTVNAQLWEKSEEFRKFLIAMIQDATKTGDVGLGNKNYDLKNTFQEDAITCWRKHGRTQNCDDYKSDKMKLLPDTKGDRKELGLSVRAANRPGVHLCVYCPYHSVVMSRARKAQGF
jgi:hypothetical protein